MYRITDINELNSILDILLTNKIYDKDLTERWMFSYIYLEDICYHTMPNLFLYIINKHNLALNNINKYVKNFSSHNIAIYLSLLNTVNHIKYQQYALNKINKSNIPNIIKYQQVYNIYKKGFNYLFPKIINNSQIIYELLFRIYNHFILNKLFTICNYYPYLDDLDIYFIQQKQILDLLDPYMRKIYLLYNNDLLDRCRRTKIDMIYYYIYFHQFIPDNLLPLFFHKIKKYFSIEHYKYFSKYIYYNKLSKDNKIKLSSILLLDQL